MYVYIYIYIYILDRRGKLLVYSNKQTILTTIWACGLPQPGAAALRGAPNREYPFYNIEYPHYNQYRISTL